MKKNPVPALLATKKVWVQDPLLPAVWSLMVLQRVAPGRGNVINYSKNALQLRRHVIPRDPRTPKQQAQRARFRAAQLAWYAQDLTSRAAWSKNGASFALSGRQLFTRNYIATNAAPIIPQPLRVIRAPHDSLWPLFADRWPSLSYVPYTFQVF